MSSDKIYLTMHNYVQMREQCEKDRTISASVLDEFLIYYSAARDKTAIEFDTRLSRFARGTQRMPAQWKGFSKSQYIAHRIFRQRGLIHKYLNQAGVKERSAEEYDFLCRMARNPWRFSFMEVKAAPEPDFFDMEDVFTGDSYLVHSPSISNILTSHRPLLWFNLISFNGFCWQTFGTVVYFNSFDPDDIFFFATELRPAIDSATDLIKDLEENPVPYMCLFSGGDYPLIESRGQEVVMVTSTIEAMLTDVRKLEDKFKLERAKGVLKMSHHRWSEPPDLANAYYEEAEGILQLTALTDRGYEKLSELLAPYVANLPAEPEIRIHMPMLTVIKNLLGKEPDLIPYSSFFE